MESHCSDPLLLPGMREQIKRQSQDPGSHQWQCDTSLTCPLSLVMHWNHYSWHFGYLVLNNQRLEAFLQCTLFPVSLSNRKKGLKQTGFVANAKSCRKQEGTWPYILNSIFLVPFLVAIKCNKNVVYSTFYLNCISHVYFNYPPVHELVLLFSKWNAYHLPNRHPKKLPKKEQICYHLLTHYFILVRVQHLFWKHKVVIHSGWDANQSTPVPT